MEELWANMSTRLDHQDLQFAALHRGMTSLHLSQYSMAQHYMPGQTFFQNPENYAAHINWPGDRPASPGEAGGNDGEGSGGGEDDGGNGDGDIDINDYLEEDDPVF